MGFTDWLLRAFAIVPDEEETPWWALPVSGSASPSLFPTADNSAPPLFGAVADNSPLPIFGLAAPNHTPPLFPLGSSFGATAKAKATSGGRGTSGGSTGSGGQLPSQADDPVLSRWSSVINQVAQETGVPADVIAAIMLNESSGDPNATSVAGAMGLMQVMPFHFQQGEDPYDPQTNVRKGAQILKDNYERIKQKRPDLPDDVAWEYAAAAYLGAFDWNRVEPTTAADAYGTTGPAYIAKFRQARSHYRQLLGNQAGSAAGGKFSATAVTGGQAYPVTQGYGATEFAQGSGMYRDHFHHGVDLGVPQGTKITAPTGGTVVFAGDAGDGYGVKVVVKLDNGYTIFVGHLSQTSVQNGQRVDAGTVLGLSGNTGASTGPHLHLGVIGPDGKERDPSELFVF